MRQLTKTLCLLFSAYFLLSFEIAAKQTPSSSIEHPFLWEISSKTLKKKSYLFGTIHVPDPRLYPLPPAIEQALNNSKWIFTEILLDSVTQMKVAQAMSLPPGQTLQASLSKETWQALDAYLKSINPTMSAFMFNRIKPWAVATQIMILQMQIKNMHVKALDAEIYERGMKDPQKQNRALEKLADQLDVLDSIPGDQQILMLEETIKLVQDKNLNVLEQLMQIYFSGDLKALTEAAERYSIPDEKLKEELMSKLLDERNVKMTHTIMEHLKKNPADSSFFAIGAAHYEGEQGIVALLEKAGYQVKRVPALRPEKK